MTVQWFAFVSEVILISVLIKIISNSAFENKQLPLEQQNKVSAYIFLSLVIIIITAAIGALKYIGISSLSSLHIYFSLVAKQIAMPTIIVLLTLLKLKEHINKASSYLLYLLLALSVTSIPLVLLFSLPELIFKAVDLTLVLSLLILLYAAIKHQERLLVYVINGGSLILMAILGLIAKVDSQLYIFSLHILLAIYLYSMQKICKKKGA